MKKIILMLVAVLFVNYSWSGQRRHQGCSLVSSDRYVVKSKAKDFVCFDCKYESWGEKGLNTRCFSKTLDYYFKITTIDSDCNGTATVRFDGKYGFLFWQCVDSYGVTIKEKSTEMGVESVNRSIADFYEDVKKNVK